MGQGLFNASIKKNSTSFESIDDFSCLINSVKDKKIVMLGESSHGTSEYYEWRSKISRELIEKHGFNFISVEGDWPSCQYVNLAIKNKVNESPVKTLEHFSRWPTWMWANAEIIEMMEWMSELNLKGHNAGFHGLDVYSLYDSIAEVKKYLKKTSPEILSQVADFYSCFDPYLYNEKAYAKSLFQFPEGCAEEVAGALEAMLESRLKKDDKFFDALQNSKTIRNAERYYRAMITGEDSWNIRDHHMMETLESLLTHYGQDSKAIVWAHNTHIGDHRATDMILYGQVNIGGLARQKYGEKEVALIGFSTYEGTVIAANAWDGKMEVMKVPKAQSGSLEDYLHNACDFMGSRQFYFFTEDFKDEALFKDYLGHRAIGVVYHPHYESRGNYVPSIIRKRYDALIFIDKTSALTPVSVKFDSEKIPETYPFGARI